MTDHVVRLYAVAAALVVFFLTWAAVAARPWNAEPAVQVAVAPVTRPADPRAAALAAQEQRLRRLVVLVDRLAARRAEANRAAAAAASRAAAIAAATPTPAPAPRIVTVTRSS